LGARVGMERPGERRGVRGRGIFARSWVLGARGNASVTKRPVRGPRGERGSDTTSTSESSRVRARGDARRRRRSLHVIFAGRHLPQRSG
jgi:hypothetical protein